MIKAFLRDHVAASRREDALLLLEEIDAMLDDSAEADQVRLQLKDLRLQHDLSEPKPDMVEDLPVFTAGLLRVRYSAVNAVQQELSSVNAEVKILMPSAETAAKASTTAAQSASIPVA